MSSAQWFAFVILPIAVMAGGWAIALLHDWYQRHLDAKEARRR